MMVSGKWPGCFWGISIFSSGSSGVNKRDLGADTCKSFLNEVLDRLFLGKISVGCR